MWPYLVTFLCAMLFSFGLGLSGMTHPSKVVGFLDFIGDWDPSLLLVMVGAVVTYFISQRLILRRNKAVFGAEFQLPTRMDLDWQLVAGAALFGVGWGLVGYCPGPALTSISTGNPTILVFLLSMSVGMYFFGALHLRYSSEPDGGASPLDHPGQPAR